MDIMTRKYINSLAQNVRIAYNVQVPICNIDEIVNRIGGDIVEKYGFDDLYDGTISKTGDSSFLIAVSPFQNSTRRSFTIAHELGHLFLHMGYRTNAELWKNQDRAVYRRFGTSEQEYQANEFAAAFLMPIEEYLEVIDQYSAEDQVNISEVANYFNVSVSAATNRGRFLGILYD